MSGDWSMMDREWPPFRPARPCGPPAGRCAPCDPYTQSFYQEEQPVAECSQQLSARYPPPEPMTAPFQFQQPAPVAPLSHLPHSYFGQMPHTKVTSLPQLCSPPQLLPPTISAPLDQAVPRGDNPREIRNKAEKQRRDKLNRSISELAGLVPPVVAASRKIDKTGVLRLTAHYLRAHQYVFGDTIGQSEPDITPDYAAAFLRLLHGFLITVTYKGLVVVVSQNVQDYLGYSELDLLGQNILTIVHPDDRRMLLEQLRPRSSLLGPSGELLVPDDTETKQGNRDALEKERRYFVIRFKKLTQRSEPAKYMTCHVEGSLRKADRACRGYTRCCQMVRRARARGDNPCSSGNDVVFIGIARPAIDTFLSEREIDSFRMEYSTRHSVDGEIIQCEQKISLVTGYMAHEVSGLNAMNFMHRDDVRWVIIALREMYDQRRLYGESCYRLMTKNGQFVYMRTRGRLEVDQSSQAVTTFVCVNTVVDEEEGKYLIRQMKKKFMMVVNNNEEPIIEEETNTDDSQKVYVEDPQQLQKVIMHLVTNLPSPSPGPDSPRSSTPDDGATGPMRLTIIPPRRERIVSAIDKIYKVIKNFDSQPQEESKKPPAKPERQTVLQTTKSSENEPIPISADAPKLGNFEESFLKRSKVGDESVPFPKISDQVLAAVQLDDEEPLEPAGKRRARSGPARCSKRKAPPSDKFLLPPDMKTVPEGLFENNGENLLDEGELDSQLDSALSLFSSMGNGSEGPGPFPGILLENEFQELFGSMEAAAEEQISDEPTD